MSAYQISKTVFCPRAGHGVTAAGQSAKNFYSNFVQSTARYRRARDPILSATHQVVPPPLLAATFTGDRSGARRTDRRMDRRTDRRMDRRMDRRTVRRGVTLPSDRRRPLPLDRCDVRCAGFVNSSTMALYFVNLGARSRPAWPRVLISGLGLPATRSAIRNRC
jgi:hypothetical protein